MAGLSIGYKVYNPYVVAIIATMGGMLFGFDISSVSALQGIDAYQNKFFAGCANGGCNSATRQSGITSAMPGGSFVACLFAGYLSDKFGRKAAIQFASFIWCVGAAVQSSSQNLAQLVIGRFIAGLAIGLASSQVPVYIAELSPKHIRGRLVGCFQWAVTWGILIMFYISYGCSKIKDGKSEATWRLAWGLQIVPGLLLFLGTLILDESPRWLATKDRWDEAIHVISMVQARGNRDDENVRIEIEEIKEAVRLEHNARVGIREMFTGSVNIRRSLIGIWCQIWQQLTGMNVMMYYVVKVFTMAGYSSSENTTLIASSIQYVLNVIMTVPALLFIDSWGRRPVLIAGAILMAGWLFAQVGIFGTYSVPTGPEGYVAYPGATPDDSVMIRIPEEHKAASRAAIAVSYLFVCTFAPTWGPAGWIYCSEIFPMEQRAVGNAITAAANWIMNFAIGMFTLPGFQNITYKTYAIYASCCVAMAIHVFLMFPETKGRTLEEVDMLFKSNVPAWKSHKWEPEFRPDINDIKAANGGRAPSLKAGVAAEHEEDIRSSFSATENKV